MDSTAIVKLLSCKGERVVEDCIKIVLCLYYFKKLLPKCWIKLEVWCRLLCRLFFFFRKGCGQIPYWWLWHCIYSQTSLREVVYLSSWWLAKGMWKRGCVVAYFSCDDAAEHCACPENTNIRLEPELKYGPPCHQLPWDHLSWCPHCHIYGQTSWREAVCQAHVGCFSCNDETLA